MRYIVNVLIVVFCFCLCGDSHVSARINLSSLDIPSLKKGDLIFREGIGADSIVISNISNSIYTHVGMVVNLEPILVIHATTNDNKRFKNQVIISTLQEFVDLSNSIAIKRFDIRDSDLNIIVSYLYSKIGEKFVLNNQSNRLYCTTLLYDAISLVMPLEVKDSRLDLPFLSGGYLLPKSLYENNQSKLIYKESFYEKKY